MEKMNIAEAKKLFTDHADQLYDDQSLFVLFQKANYMGGIKNDSYIHALSLTRLMLDNMFYSLKMLTGPSCDGFLDVLQKSFKRALTRIKNNQGQARIIIAGESPQAVFLTEMQRQFGKETLDVINAIPRKEARVTHFVTCDSSILRDEEYHSPLTDDSPVENVKAIVYLNNPSKAKAAEQRFNSNWRFLKKRDA